jgi:hypothetical protein
VGFEPTASASRTQRSTKLSHSPKSSRAQQLVRYFAYFGAAGKQFRWQKLAFVGRLEVRSKNSSAAQLHELMAAGYLWSDCKAIELFRFLSGAARNLPARGPGPSGRGALSSALFCVRRSGDRRSFTDFARKNDCREKLFVTLRNLPLGR